MSAPVEDRASSEPERRKRRREAMRVFGTEIPKSELLRRVGNLAQVGSVELLSARAGLRARQPLPRLPHRQRLPLLRPRRPGPGSRVTPSSTAHRSRGSRRSSSRRRRSGRTTTTRGCASSSAASATPRVSSRSAIRRPSTSRSSSSTRARRTGTGPTTASRSSRPATSTSVSGGRESAASSGPRAPSARRSSTARIFC